MATTTTTALLELQQRLSKIKRPIDKRVLVGFDGFVDTIKKAVKQRRNFKTEYYKTCVSSQIEFPLPQVRAARLKWLLKR